MLCSKIAETRLKVQAKARPDRSWATWRKEFHGGPDGKPETGTFLLIEEEEDI